MASTPNPIRLLGIPELDEQHQGIQQAVARLREQIGGQCSDVEALLDEIYELLCRHHECEEGVMQSVEFFGIAEHKADHRKMEVWLMDLKTPSQPDGPLQPGKTGDRAKIFGRLIAHIMKHINNTNGYDQKFLAWLKSQNINPASLGAEKGGSE